MKKRIYIQPRIEKTELMAGSLMIPSSPTDGGYDPHTMPIWRPKNPTHTPVF